MCELAISPGLSQIVNERARSWTAVRGRDGRTSLRTGREVCASYLRVGLIGLENASAASACSSPKGAEGVEMVPSPKMRQRPTWGLSVVKAYPAIRGFEPVSAWRRVLGREGEMLEGTQH